MSKTRPDEQRAALRSERGKTMFLLNKTHQRKITHHANAVKSGISSMRAIAILSEIV
jgi:hypothetical protein